MQIERKLQVGTLAFLLSLVAIAGPVDSQGPEDCIPAFPPTFPPAAPDPTCAGDPGVLPEGCDPTDPATCAPAPDLSALDPLCDLNPEAADPTFPGCLSDFSPPVGPPEGCDPTDPTTCAPEPDLGVLDALCAINTAAVDPTFPGCLLELASPPSVPDCDPTDFANASGCVPDGPSPPEGCDPTDPATCVPVTPPEFPPEGCDPADPANATNCVPSVDPSLLDALCGVLNAGAADPTFPNCVLELLGGEEPANTPPVADAGSDVSVSEDSTIGLDGLGSSDADDDALTYAWACADGSLDDASSATPEFTPDNVGNEGATVLCSLVVNDGTEDSPADAVEITVTAVNADPSVSTEDAEANEASPVELVASADDADGDSLEFAWEQTSGTAVTLAGADSDTLSFTAPNLAGLEETLSFTVTVSDGYGGEDSAVASVLVKNIGSGSSTGHVTVGAATASFVLHDPEPSVAAGEEPTDVTYSSELQNNNGLELVDDDLVGFTVTGPQGLSVAEDFDSSADSRDPDFPNGPEDVVRQYVYDLTFPARLADGDYSLAATYDGAGPAPADFTVANVAPTIDGALASHAGRSSFPATTSVASVSVDDLNWGSYDGAGVTELSTLTFAVTDQLDAPVLSGFTFEAALDGETFAPTTSLGLGALTDNAAVSIPLQVSYDDTVAAGTYTVTVTVTDDDGATDSVDLFSILLVPANFGFTITLDDGGDGIELNDGADVQPDGSVYDTASDPLTIDITGTLGAASLELGIADFTSEDTDDVITVEGMNVRIYSDGQVIGVDEPAFEGAVADNLLVVDLLDAGLGASLSSLRVVLDLQVLPGADAADYSSAVDVLSFADE